MTFRITILKALCRLLAALPLPTALAIGRGLGNVAAVVIRHRRRETVARIQTCLPDRSREQCEAIYRGMFRHLSMNLVEMLRASALGPEDVFHRVTLHGTENLDAALRSDGQGILGLTGHIGNWEFCSAITQILDQPVAVVVKTMRDPAVQRHLEATRRRLNLVILPHRNSFRACLQSLRKGIHVTVILDQNRSREQGVFVDFFGQPASTSPGLAALSAHSRSSVLPVFDIRDPDHLHHHLHLLPALPPPEGRGIDTLTAATQTYTRIIEDMIRAHPEQWIWLHRRWRTQPVIDPAPTTDD